MYNPYSMLPQKNLFLYAFSLSTLVFSLRNYYVVENYCKIDVCIIATGKRVQSKKI